MPKEFFIESLNLLLRLNLFLDIISYILDSNNSPSLSKSVRITYFLFVGNVSINLSTAFPERVKMFVKPIFSNAILSRFPSTINEKSDKSSTNFSIL